MAGSMKDIKLRIKSVESTMQITKAMELVASSKMRRAKERVEHSRPYFETLHETLTKIAAADPRARNPYLRRDEVKRTLLIVIAGDRGLAGGYNSNVLKQAAAEEGEVLVLPIGKRSAEYFVHHEVPLFTQEVLLAADVSVGECFQLSRQITEGYRKGEYDAVKICYTRFDSMMTQTAATMEVLPLSIEPTEQQKAEARRSQILYKPSSEEVFSAIIPEYVAGIVYGAVCESVASELAARRTAMDAATQPLTHMLERLSDYQELYGDLYNLEATPAESTAYRLAKHDKARYPDIITAHEGGTPYYTNSSHLPVGYTEDVFAALDVQDKLQTLYTSGTVFHTFLGEKLPSWQSAAALVRKIAENYELPYYTLSPTYSICTEHGYLKGEQKTCPICGKATEVYSRITGYYRPVQNWNDGKSQEFLDRKTYQVGGAQEDCPKRREDKAAGKPAGGYYLYTTSTCPNCHIIKPILEKAGIPFVERDAEQYLQEATALGLTHAPSLVVQANPPIIYAGVARIKEFLEQA